MYERNPVSYNEAREGFTRPQMRYGVRVPVERCVLNYHRCNEEKCGGYFATARGLEDHTSFVHAPTQAAC